MNSTLLYRSTILLFVMVIMSVAAYPVSRPFYDRLVVEDGWIEYLTAIALALTGIYAMACLFTNFRNLNPLQKVVLTALSLLMLFGAGEEISWGQRLFDIRSADFFLEHNLQQEINVHNLELYGLSLNRLIFSNLLVVVLTAYFCLFPFGYRYSVKFRNRIDHAGIPIPRIEHTAAMLAGTTMVLLIPDDKVWEIWEGSLSLMVFAIMMRPYNEERLTWHIHGYPL